MNKELRIKGLKVSIEQKKILMGVDLVVQPGKLHVVMGPNGSGKSTLAASLMGHPNYEVTAGKVTLGKTNLLALEPHERAKKGLMLAFQNPLTVPGVTLSNFLRTSYHELYGKKARSVLEFHKFVHQKAKDLSLDATFLRRGINEGFSGGEKKKAEILQLLVLRPKFAIFDEIDTGLDIDALKVVSQGIHDLKKEGAGILLITHYQRILTHVLPDVVHIMKQGAIVKTGGTELVAQIEEKGYAHI